MKVPVSIVIQSHLSDLLEMNGDCYDEQRIHRIRFVKFLVIHFRNTTVLIDAEEVYNEFLKQQ